jgi:hypothetical protein
VKLVTNFNLVPRLKNMGLYFHFPILLQRLLLTRIQKKAFRYPFVSVYHAIYFQGTYPSMLFTSIHFFPDKRQHLITITSSNKQNYFWESDRCDRSDLRSSGILRLISQKSADLINNAAEAWNQNPGCLRDTKFHYRFPKTPPLKPYSQPHDLVHSLLL